MASYSGPAKVEPADFHIVFDELVVHAASVGFRLEAQDRRAGRGNWSVDGTAMLRQGFYEANGLLVHHDSQASGGPASIRITLDVRTEDHCTVTAFFTRHDEDSTWKLHGTLDRFGFIEDD